ncbi:MAG: lysophospholipid acyltransferase family protein [Acidobacteria bacterium]|nr:lysophospholipid acyltransferase family protein [Acidobacteriota bacterium]
MLGKSFAYYAAHLALKFFAALPRSVAYPLSHAIAAAYCLFDRRHRRVGLTNLRIAFPQQTEKWRARTLKRSYRILGDLLVEVSKFPKLTRDNVEWRVSYTEGSLARYRKAKQKEMGLLFLTAHLSAWELLPFVHALYGHPLSFLARPIDDRDVDALLTRYRTRSGNRIIPKKNALRSILRVLQNKEDVGFLIDQNVLPHEGVFVPFFGKQACTTNGVARIALRTGAPVLAGFLLPLEEPGRYCIHFGDEIPLCREGSLEENIRATTERFSREVENIIRRYPEHWFWLHKRWKARPPGSEELIYP